MNPPLRKAALLFAAVAFAVGLSAAAGFAYYFLRLWCGGSDAAARSYGEGAATMSFGMAMYDFPWKQWWEER